ncbi:MAG: hypothetical protein NC341_13295 [Blautia sp.]|nr:hypothetical protein [Blautia sp.]MCM1202450.1 hypothetical protein [Bacteroides fragilis]
MQNQIKHIREKYASSLSELFRLIYHITAREEDEINKRKYLFRNVFPCENDANTKIFKIFYDTEEFRRLTEDKKKDYGAVVEDGINPYEGLQNRQDAAIRINVLYGLFL